ncbi:MAG: zinc-dependent alcohol dehydrogenase [Phenylobacterium sp.]|uniref:zinc-dependent alcohol dehydrogenase n=1 Tax=Phenylobacterium sp. TaxID=1871053 RepID=UPI0027359B2E|nr:zinc-dependent alcohol dehydrogenase [Phenylobacterium sp.]MDP1640735.1 zinc-dependent alcohol dehydrogenase [Phenylobacterium sp.]MDP3118508.1 zinc-dependent alcohol dehydrogenase [Phenylobacterium sp.]
MKAICWQGKKDLRCEEVPDPIIEDPKDAIIRVTSTCICGSDLHLMNGLVPTMCVGDVMGHEAMGEVVEAGPEARAQGLKVGDRVVVPFQMTCGACEQCLAGNYSVCQTTNRNSDLAKAFFGDTTAGLFGYSHITGGYAGGQAEYLRVPHAATTLIQIPKTGADETYLFLSDILPTGWQAAAFADIQPTDTVAVWGCGPVGLFAIQSAIIQGAQRVIAIDDVPERLAMAADLGAETLDRSAHKVLPSLKEMTDGHGPEKCIDAVGLEAHGPTPLLGMIDRVQTALKLETERPVALREAIMACKAAGTVSVPGVYGGLANMIPLGALMNKGLTLRTGQTHVRRWSDDLLRRLDEGEIDPTFLITHTEPLGRGPEMYKTFRDKKDGCVKVVLKP